MSKIQKKCTKELKGAVAKFSSERESTRDTKADLAGCVLGCWGRESEVGGVTPEMRSLQPIDRAMAELEQLRKENQRLRMELKKAVAIFAGE